MAQEPREGAEATTIDDLPDNLRYALLSGFRAADWFGDRGDAGAGSEDAESQQACEDGRRLAEAVSMLLSADLADYANDKARYARLADELNERYGSEVVVRVDEMPEFRPGFRTRKDA